MQIRELPDLSPAQVVQLLDALLANADALLTSALAALELGHVALARSLAILGLEESGKAIGVHERRVQMSHEPEGESFRCSQLDELWGSHRKKLDLVHRFLVQEQYWFGVEPSDPARNKAYLGTIKAWSRRHDRLKQRGFYVDLGKDGAVMAPSDVADEEALTEVIRYVHQIGWQLRLGEHIEGKRQDEQERGSPPIDPDTLRQWFGDVDVPLPPDFLEAMQQGNPGEQLNNAAYRFNPPGADRTPFRNLDQPGYEAQTRELLAMKEDLDPGSGKD